jgi:hypothetical protein
VEEVVHAVDVRVAKLEAYPPMTVQEMSRLLDTKVARIKNAIAQTSQNNRTHALHDKITTLEVSLRSNMYGQSTYDLPWVDDPNTLSPRHP